MKLTTRAGVLAGLATLVAATPALAAPVTVNLRVEGATKTLVEQPVTVDVRTFKFSDSPQTYTCDGTGADGSTTVPSPTRNGALAEAAEKGGLELTGSFGQYGASFSRINGESVASDRATGNFLGEYKNYKFASFGGCGDAIVSGDDVLFAYGDGSETLLKLAGPSTVAPGATATLNVTDGGTGAAVAGAAAGGKSSGTDGKLVTAPLTTRGPNLFKASKTGAIRSNAVSVCVTDGTDGFCGTTKPGSSPVATPPTTPVPAGPLFGGDDTSSFAKITSIKEGQKFTAANAPRELKGTVDDDFVGVKDVRLRISRTDGRRCYKYIGSSDREEFVRTRRCSIKSSRTFSVSDKRTWQYLLPEKPAPGRYVLDVIVKDQVGHQTKSYQRGRNRVVFYVK